MNNILKVFGAIIIVLICVLGIKYYLDNFVYKTPSHVFKDWFKDLDKALKYAKQNNIPVMVKLGTST